MRPARLVIAMFATACLLAGAGVLAVSGPASAAGSPSGVLISQLRTRSATSQFDEYVQITNTTNAAVDLSGRPYVVHEEPGNMAPLIGSYDTTLTRHVFESMAFSAAICLHVRVLYGRNPHHIVEAQFKAVARALRTALAPDLRAGGIPSTKGVL